MQAGPGDTLATIVVECPKCGHVHEATRADIVRGSWRDCPACTPEQLSSRYGSMASTPDEAA